jgi:hypothetical protein
MLFEQVAKAPDGNLVSAQREPCKPAQRLTILDRVFCLRVQEVEPVLQKNDPQYLLQSQRLPSLTRFGAVQLDRCQ